MVAQKLFDRTSPDTVGSRGGAMNNGDNPKVIPLMPQYRGTNSTDLQKTATKFRDSSESYGMPSLDTEIEAYMYTVHNRYKALGIRATVIAFTFFLSVALIIFAIMTRH